jgi:hypothetical protein
MKTGKVCLMVGTRKGAFVFTSDDSRSTWKSSGPYLKGNEIYHMAYDGRSGTFLASLNSGHFGPTIATRKGLEAAWKVSKSPPKFPKSSGLSVAKIWQIKPASEDQPGVVYAGIEPACLFRSDDGGVTWKVNQAMMNHKTRKKWQPGGGGLCLHTILVNERRPGRIMIAISAVGAMKSEDDGETWRFQNKGVIAGFQPNKYPEYGTCVHKLAINSANPDVIFQQNHSGVYRSDDAGESWKNIKNNLPSHFGFPAAVDANEPKRFYLAPLEGDFSRIPPDGHFAVWTTDNAGKEWRPLDSGLPKVSYFTVLRDGMVADQEDPCGLYFGSTTGQLFASRNQGNNWTKITDGLPPILSVSVSAM